MTILGICISASYFHLDCEQFYKLDCGCFFFVCTRIAVLNSDKMRRSRWEGKKLKHRYTQTKFSQGKKTLRHHQCKMHQPCCKWFNQKSHNESLDSNQRTLKPSHLLCTGQLYLSLHLKKRKNRKKTFSLLFWCSEEHAFSTSSEFRGDFRWVARPHSLITRSKTPAELQAAPRGIKPPPAVASSSPTC